MRWSFWVAIGGSLFSALLARAEWVDIAQIRVSERLANQLLYTPIGSQTTLSETVDNTAIKGTSWTRGQVLLDFKPDNFAATVNLSLTAQTTIVATGKNVPRPDIRVTFGTNSWTNLAVTKPLHFDINGMRGDRLLAGATTQLDVKWLNAFATGLPIIRGIKRAVAAKKGWETLEEKKAEMESGISTKAVDEASQQIETKAAPTIASANATYDKLFLKPYLQADKIPGQLRFQTTETHVYLTLAENRAQLDAYAPSPFLPFDAADVGLALHEPAFTRVADKMAGGKTFTEDELATFLPFSGSSEGVFPTPVAGQVDKGVLSVTLEKQHPIVVHFFDRDRISIQLRASSFKWGETTYPGATIEARYRVVLPGSGKVKWVRESGPEFTKPVERELENIVRERYSNLFPGDWTVQELPLNGTAVKLYSSRAWISDGWLMLTWGLATKEGVALP